MNFLNVGTKAFIMYADLDPWEVSKAKNNFTKLRDAKIVEVMICDRHLNAKTSKTTERDFNLYSVCFTSEVEANEVLETPRQLPDRWDKPFDWDGPIAADVETLCSTVMEELNALRNGYKTMIGDAGRAFDEFLSSSEEGD
ncbi:MAG: hypothetical protein GY841_15665 [FCB group bacterium]|nr:hypothetical protein [FCB group bacterium]